MATMTRIPYESQDEKRAKEQKTIAGNLGGILAATLSSVIDVCDKQYVRLEEILTKEWYRLFMQDYARLYSIETALADDIYQFSAQISPLTQNLIDRLKRLEHKPISLKNKILIKLD